MSDLVLEYFAWLSGLLAPVTLALRGLANDINLPLVSALLFGLMGTTAPCQLSTNVAALAFLSRNVNNPRRLWWHTLAYVAGKLTVYMLVGGLLVLFSLKLGEVSETVIPVVVFARRALGPLLIVVGLLMLGVFKARLSVGARLSRWLEEQAARRQGLAPAYLLGMAFSFAFCPTLFVLFFGLTIPLAIASPGGIVFPGVFAIGSALPVLAIAGLLASGSDHVGRFIRGVKSANRRLQRMAAVLFVIVGIHETILYWLI